MNMTARDAQYSNIRGAYNNVQIVGHIEALTTHVLQHDLPDDVLCEVTLKQPDGTRAQLPIHTSDLFVLLGVSARIEQVLNQARTASSTVTDMVRKENPTRQDLQHLRTDLSTLYASIEDMVSPYKVSEVPANRWNDSKGNSPRKDIRGYHT